MNLLVDVLRGGLGILILLLICYLISNNRKAIDWKLVGVGVTMQIVLGIMLLRVPIINSGFEWISNGFVNLLNFSEAGAEFLFGGLIDASSPLGYIFAFQVLPTIIFFSALSSILYYFGILQKIVFGLAWLMKRTMGLSGPESLAAAANVFIGQTEAPLIVQPYLEKMTKSELLCLMTGGMATIAGGVFAAYIGYLGGDDPVAKAYFAKHLLTASIISAPAAIAAAKMIFPETQKKDISSQMEMVGSEANNLLDAISKGTTDGLKLAVNVGVMLIVFTALIYMLNVFMMSTFGTWFGWNDKVVELTDGRFEGFDFTFLIGIVFAPFAWLLGTATEDVLVVGQLLGQKTMINEFYAYAALGELKASGLEMNPKSLIIATYALCGFANFASIGIQIGGISAIAPGQRKNLTELGVRALIGGTIACFMTAAVAGIIT